MAKLFRRLALAIATIALAACAAVAGSYALFTDTVTVSHHLQAGTLQAVLTRKTLVGNTLTTNGYFDDYEGEPNVDFTDETQKNVFDLENEMIVPQSYREATMELTNDGSVAFSYWIEIVLTSPTQAKDVALSEQLLVSVQTENAGAGMSLSDAPIQNNGNKITIGSAQTPVGEVGLLEAKTFSVKVVFKDYGGNINNENDKAQGGQLAFDMVVYAVQAA